MKKSSKWPKNFESQFMWEEQKKKPKLYKNWKLYAITLPIAAVAAGTAGGVYYAVHSNQKNNLTQLKLDKTVTVALGASQEEVFQAFLNQNHDIFGNDLTRDQVELGDFNSTKYGNNSLTITANPNEKWTGSIEVKVKYFLSEDNFQEIMLYLSQHNLLQFEIPSGYVDTESLSKLYSVIKPQLNDFLRSSYEFADDIKDISVGGYSWNFPGEKPSNDDWNTSGYVLNLPRFGTYLSINYYSGKSKDFNFNDNPDGADGFKLNVSWTVKESNQLTQISAIEAAILNNENRSFQHSYLTPTGYFLEKGKEYTIKINKGAQTSDLLYLSIGQQRSYQGLNNGQDVGFETMRIVGNVIKITPKNSGMLYLKDYHFTNQFKILTISNNPIKVPTFIVNQTNQTAFFKEIATTKSFFVEVISDHIFGTFQTQMFKDEVVPNAKVDINHTLQNWDKVWNYTNEVYDLQDEMVKYPQYIHIANPDDGAGYAYSTEYFISFQNSTGAGKDLFTNADNDQWGLWHEIGHSYQTPQYKWSDLTEVTVNISSLYVQQKMYGENRLDDKDTIDKIKAWFATDKATKDYNQQSDLFVKVAMFWQLQMAFGDNFYPRLSQFYRTHHNTLVIDNDTDMQEQFVLAASKLVDRNLLPFFEKWGLKVSDKTKQIVEGLWPLRTDIWENIINGTHQPVVEVAIN